MICRLKTKCTIDDNNGKIMIILTNFIKILMIMLYKNDEIKGKISFIEKLTIFAYTKGFTLELMMLGYPVVYFLLLLLFCYKFQMLFLELIGKAFHDPLIFEEIYCLNSRNRVPLIVKDLPFETTLDELDKALIVRIFQCLC